MVASIGQTVALATHANAALKGHDVSLDEASNGWFQHTQPLTFGAGEDQERLYATGADEWMQRLKTDGFSTAYEWFEPPEGLPNGIDSVAFVGGQRWATVTVSASRQVIWHIRAKNDPSNEQRPWRIYMAGYQVMPGQSSLSATIQEATSCLSAVLEDLLRFDAQHPREHDHFSKRFRIGIDQLTSNGPWPEPVLAMFPGSLYPVEAYRLAAAVNASWCIRGMGRWNDWWSPDTATQAEFDALNISYYTAVGRALHAATNVDL